MSKTLRLRNLVNKHLRTVQGGTYHRKAPPNATYPYKTFNLESVGFTDARDDIYLEVNIWDRNTAENPKTAECIADQVERLFSGVNLPAPPIYPTFFRENRYDLEDPDKNLQHIQLRFLVQLYEEE